MNLQTIENSSSAVINTSDSNLPDFSTFDSVHLAVNADLQGTQANHSASAPTAGDVNVNLPAASAHPGALLTISAISHGGATAGNHSGGNYGNFIIPVPNGSDSVGFTSNPVSLAGSYLNGGIRGNTLTLCSDGVSCWQVVSAH